MRFLRVVAALTAWSMQRFAGPTMFCEAMNELFTPWTQRGVTSRNRIVVSPMCEYSCTGGLANDWHLVHLGSRAVGGAGIIISEAAAVTPEGRISPGDLGLWSAAHADALSPITAFLRAQGAVAGVQLAHAGRKASTAPPWEGRRSVPPSEGGWEPVAPSALEYGGLMPRALSLDDIADVRRAFAQGARLALEAGFDLIELHGAHGYLIHEFLSPITNHRTDEYGGSFENRVRFALEVVDAVRGVWPEDKPLWVRISAIDWIEGGWTIEDSVALSKRLRERGVDAIDCSSGGIADHQDVKIGVGYQVPFSAQIRREAGISTVAVGLIEEPEHAADILRSGEADAIAMARGMLRDPYWPLHAAARLGVDVPWPVQYERAKPRPVAV